MSYALLFVHFIKQYFKPFLKALEERRANIYKYTRHSQKARILSRINQGSIKEFVTYAIICNAFFVSFTVLSTQELFSIIVV